MGTKHIIYFVKGKKKSLLRRSRMNRDVRKVSVLNEW